MALIDTVSNRLFRFSETLPVTGDASPHTFFGGLYHLAELVFLLLWKKIPQIIAAGVVKGDNHTRILMIDLPDIIKYFNIPQVHLFLSVQFTVSKSCVAHRFLANGEKPVEPIETGRI